MMSLPRLKERHVFRDVSATHREHALRHVQARAWERLGVALSTPEVIRLSERCAAGEFGVLGNPDGHGRFHVQTVLRGHDVRLIYCPTLKVVVTLLQRPIGRKSGDWHLHPEVRR